MSKASVKHGEWRRQSQGFCSPVRVALGLWVSLMHLQDEHLCILTLFCSTMPQSRASGDQKPALETGGLWLCLALVTAHCCVLENLSVLPSGQGRRSRALAGPEKLLSPSLDPVTSPGTAALPQVSLSLSQCQPILSPAAGVRSAEPSDIWCPCTKGENQVSCKKDTVPHKQRGACLSVRPTTNPHARWLLLVLGGGSPSRTSGCLRFCQLV